MSKPTKPTPKKGGRKPRNWRPVFLAGLERFANVSGACRAARIHRCTAYDARSEDSVFRAAWDEALEVGCDDLEVEVRRRAKDGTLKPVFYQGKQCGAIREYSDVLAMFLLKAHRPAKYRERISVDTCPSLTPETVKLLSDVEIEDAISGKMTPAQIDTIIAVRRAQHGDSDSGRGRHA